jgi:multidrug resistance efflux pump
VSDGQSVELGEELAVLENPELGAYLAKLKLQKETLHVQQAFALSRQMDKEIPSLRAQVLQFDTAIKKQAQDVAALQMRAPVRGMVIGQKLQDKVGTLLRQGELLCEILPDGPLQAVVVLKENEASLVEVGQSVTFRLLSSPGKASPGKVLTIASSPSLELPHQSLSQYAGGTVPSVLTDRGNNSAPIALPSSLVYKATIALEDPNGILRPGMSGLVKIQCGQKPLGAVLYLKFRNMLRTDFQI